MLDPVMLIQIVLCRGMSLSDSSGHCARGILGSLSTRVFETRTATGSELFSLLTSPRTTTFTLLRIFSPLEMNSIKIWETIRS